jgi:5-methylcytosine-specific restriction protein A
MQIKPVSPEAIETALKIFDNEWRDSKEYAGWEKNKNYLHAISHGTRLYPPKKVISLATGMPTNSFYGGAPSNNYLSARGFTIVLLRPEVAKLIPTFVVGKLYKRATDIHQLYGGSAQSGISSSAMTDAIFLFTGDSGQQYGYKDGPTLDDDGNVIYLYTGEGQAGDMQFTRGNLSIAEHSASGRALHLFHALGKSLPCRYLGEYVYAGHEIKIGKDKNLNDRKVIVFHLVSVVDAERFEDFIDAPGNETSTAENNLAEARKRALAAINTANPGDKHGVRNLYKRSRAVREYVLLRAKGICESCGKPAPFQRVNGSPYLEPHHTTRVSDGGPDHPAYVGAICPTCHREIHYGIDGANKNAALQRHLFEVEALGFSELIEKIDHAINAFQLRQLNLDSDFLSAIRISSDMEHTSAVASGYLQMITIDSSIKKGESKKLSNLTINIKKVFRDTAAAIIGGQIFTALAPAPALPLLLAAFGLCISLSEHSEVAVDHDHTLVVYALWKNVDRENQISMVDAFEVSKQAFSIRQLQPLTQKDFGFIMNDLKNLKFIKVAGNTVELLEKVTFSR